MGIGQNIVMGEFRSVHLGSALHVLLHSSLSDGVFSSAAQLNAATSFILSRHSSSRHESKNEYQVTVSFELMCFLCYKIRIFLYYCTLLTLLSQSVNGWTKPSNNLVCRWSKLHTLYYYNSFLNCVYTCWPLNIIPANFNVLALWFRAKGWEMNWQMTMSTVKHCDRLWHCLVECLCVSEFWSSPFGVAVRQELLPTVVNPFPPRPFDPLILPNQENCLLSPLTYIPMLGLKAALSPHHMKLCWV